MLPLPHAGPNAARCGVLTPVEEAGLAGQRLAGRIRRALWSLGDAELAELLRNLERQATAEHLVYLRDDVQETVRVFATPIAALPDQLSYVRTATLLLSGALKRLPELYLADPEVARVLALPPDEESWLRELWRPEHAEANPMFARHDAVCDFASPGWQASLWFIEPNLTGVGGLHMIPAAEALISRQVLPVLARRDPGLELERAQDIRGLLMQELVDHGQAIGRPVRTVCFLEPKYEGAGPDEQVELARYFQEHFQIEVCHADPAELSLVGEEVLFEGKIIDLAYRDYGVADLLEVAAEGVDVAPMRALFRQNRMISSIGAELDQKACWEVLTDPRFAHYFGPDERRCFRRHLPWTRLVAERVTHLADGSQGELVPYVLAEREHLVMKPNRGYGGAGVAIGAATSPERWHELVSAALVDPERWVVQQAVTLPAMDFPVLDDAGVVHAEPFYVVYGFAASAYGLASLLRASQHHVVNLAQRGGMCTLAVGHPPGRLAR